MKFSIFGASGESTLRAFRQLDPHDFGEQTGAPTLIVVAIVIVVVVAEPLHAVLAAQEVVDVEVEVVEDIAVNIVVVTKTVALQEENVDFEVHVPDGLALDGLQLFPIHPPDDEHWDPMHPPDEEHWDPTQLPLTQFAPEQLVTPQAKPWHVPSLPHRGPLQPTSMQLMPKQ